MKHPYEKIMRIELFSLGLSIFIGLIALIQSSILFILVSFYLAAISLACDAFNHNYTSHRRMQGLKQAIRAALLFLLATALIFLL